ncbi:hypothetical protein A3J20_03215 [Candidatus Gottesmanbacteria bacterium RIFCSPLOWO2_02_FULL_42_29]|uniref:Addiction module toxin RelE n=2 Tax=Candidatus Gottesmaniibacteriota TaxID=1752720 RepID=A0A1F6B7Q4_9BACT|nr:MAG: Addiction module toxin, RelE/StbE family [Candidatus Gottesmanbacteria bacterium GW2011_GWA2_42_18]KKS74755.1 MAG: Addiction module toxin, RelE/StbE family [Candidatus Gottesmanbacteria bacterium GW2011_GWC2_42_8]OGG10873.1 MAG: hypothetical protein A2781_02110 [Candidatus Gottesmanbacteria bacterium RIFCSPHIGHO2_01_FULL_42_27]OGG19204.1 MAG: hypothetical protein A3E72_00380 [Candidatus Gottesmanbacteria bacterium RIFCSPHIGHO2_12_FULL_43_26]OGG32966.1 MAG: hypothetical protein A2968_069
MYKYEFTPQALKQLKKLPPETQVKIIKKLEYFISTDYPLVFAGHLTNFSLGQYRFRIGDYRVIFDVEDSTMVILAVGDRKNIYR